MDFNPLVPQSLTRASRSPLPRTLPRKKGDQAAFRQPSGSNSDTKKIWSGRRGSNPRPRPWQGRAPAELRVWIPSLPYLIGEAAFVFMAYLLRQDRHSIQIRMRTLLGIGGRQDRSV